MRRRTLAPGLLEFALADGAVGACGGLVAVVSAGVMARVSPGAAGTVFTVPRSHPARSSGVAFMKPAGAQGAARRRVDSPRRSPAGSSMARVVAGVLSGVVAGVLASAPAPASASVPPAAAPPANATTMPPAEVTSALPGARLIGQGTLRWFGLAVYEARLWARDGFDGQRFEAHPFALELRYLRRLDGTAITERALDEMRRSGPIAATEAAAWRAAMRAAFPDVGPGDRLTGVHDPAQGTRFHFNGRVTGVLADTLFARRFYAVWLGTQTSQPALRAQLLGAAQ